MGVILDGTRRRDLWIEPFLGGANMAVVAVDHFDHLLLNELNPQIAAMWRDGIAGWRPPTQAPCRDEYDEMRQSGVIDAHHGFVSLGASFKGKHWGGFGATDKHGTRDYYAESWRSFDADCARLAGRASVTCGDYTALAVTDGIVYCDPPYVDTTGYGSSWDGDRFWRWASAAPECWVSEYVAPDGWTSVHSVSRASTVDATKTRTNVEHLFRKSQLQG
jgi:DNA adenine methylase